MCETDEGKKTRKKGEWSQEMMVDAGVTTEKAMQHEIKQ